MAVLAGAALDLVAVQAVVPERRGRGGEEAPRNQPLSERVLLQLLKSGYKLSSAGSKRGGAGNASTHLSSTHCQCLLWQRLGRRVM